MGDQENISAKREAARRARRLAAHFSHLEDRQRALAFAAELERQADALELASQAAEKVVAKVEAQAKVPRPKADKAADEESS